MRSIRSLITVFCCLFAAEVQARSLTWQDCIRLVEENNANLKANEAQLRSTMAQEGVAESGFLPQLNYSGGWGRSTDSTWDFVNGSPTHAPGSYTSKLNLNENIFNGFQDIEKLRQARANTAAALAGLLGTKAWTSFNLKQAYENYMYAKSYQKLTVDIIQRLKENLHIVELRFQSGRENKGSVLLSRANLNQAKFDDLQARDMKQVAKVQLKKSLGLDDDDDLDVYEEIPTQNWGTTVPNFRALLQKIPDYVQAISNTESAKHGILVAKSAFYPQFSLFGEYGNQGFDFYPDVPHWMAGININLSLFNGGKDYSTVVAAVETETQNENQQLSTARQDMINLRQNYQNLIEAIAKLKVDESFKEAAKVRAEIARRKYNNGLLSFDDWDIIEEDLISREKNYLQSVQNRVMSEASWEQARGTGVIP